MNLAKYSFLIFIFLKQFYIFKSGTLQPGDLFLLISFLLCIVNKKRMFYLSKIDCLLAIFLFFVILINLIYYYIYLDIDFIMSTLHYIFSFIVVIVFRRLLQEGNFISQLLNVLKINLILQVIILILGLGEYYGSIRYMGTFNDPNQFAFFVYTTLMLLVLGSKLELKKVSVIYYLITLIMIFESGSTGMLLAILIFLGLDIAINVFIKSHTKLYKLKFRVIKIIPFLLITTVLLIFLVQNREEISKNLYESPILQRLEQKLEKVQGKKESGLIEERGIDKLLLYPEKIILGAGQGKYSRFDKAAHQLEIHSTFPSILFYYGILPTFILLCWIYKHIRYLPIEIYSVILSLFLESFTLLNQRQPFFWMIFILVGFISHQFKMSKNIRRL
ncbi:Lipid A core-O-antigen ligase and related enzymes [Turicibacter sanguinis]|nr:Lipid A core-O-antigen ligase and related enzymes [Turicibacter sanguinis]